MYKPKKKFMKVAIEEARKNNKCSAEYPHGAVIVKDNKIIAKSGQSCRIDVDTSAHAEIAAMRVASKKLKRGHLKECILYSTNEPCCMCTGAAIWAHMKGIVYGATIKDMEDFWIKRRGIKKSAWRMIYIPCKEVLTKTKPKNVLFVVGKFMRKECNALFDLTPPLAFDRKWRRPQLRKAIKKYLPL